jgi:uncharacterized protein
MYSSFLDLFRNVFFWSAFCAWTAAQFTKMLCGFYRTHRLDFNYMVSTGGMPSAHSAMANGLATAVGIKQGFGSPIFVLTLSFALIVMFDAATVRRAAGMQARLLNEIIDELFKSHHFSERKLKHLLGHTRLEVFLGMVIGVFVGMIVTSVETLLLHA